MRRFQTKRLDVNVSFVNSMGSGASNNYESLPERMTKEQVKDVCAERFDEEVYLALKDEDGTVTRDKFLSWFKDEQEQETRNLYSFYSFHGKMSLKDLIHMLRDCKMFKKSKFIVTDMNNIDTLCKEKGYYESSDHIPYHVFRSYVVPMIAERLQDDVQHVIYRISECEPRLVLRLSSSKKAEEGPLIDATDEQQAAAAKIQQAARAKLAREEMANQKILRMIAETSFDVDKDFVLVPLDNELEKQLHDKFISYATMIEQVIGRQKFVDMCVENDIMSKTFTKKTAHIIFSTVLSKVKAPNALQEAKYSVLRNKYLQYPAFRRLALPLIAQAKGLDYETCVHYFVD